MIKTFYTALISLFRLCLFQGSPAGLPYSGLLLALFIFLSVVLFSPELAISQAEVMTGKALSIAVLAGVLYLFLWRKKQTQRLHKTLLAWLGTELLFATILNLLELNSAESFTGIVLFFLVWSLLVKSYILKLTFNISTGLAFLSTCGLHMIMVLPFMIILGPELPTPTQ